MRDNIHYPRQPDNLIINNIKIRKNMCELEGTFATLKIPYLGDRQIQLIEKNEYKWLVEICGSGRQIEVYEDEFIRD